MEEENQEVKSFNDLGLSEQLVEACDKLGWKAPLKIQIEAIPLALEGYLCFKYSPFEPETLLINVIVFTFSKS